MQLFFIDLDLGFKIWYNFYTSFQSNITIIWNFTITQYVTTFHTSHLNYLETKRSRSIVQSFAYKTNLPSMNLPLSGVWRKIRCKVWFMMVVFRLIQDSITSRVTRTINSEWHDCLGFYFYVVLLLLFFFF